jgi:hypothetical protein
VPEADWKEFRKLREAALEKLSGQILDDVVRVCTDRSRSAHDRYVDFAEVDPVAVPEGDRPRLDGKARVHPFADPGDSLQRRHRQHLARPQPLEELPKGKDPDFPKSQTPVSQVDADGAGDHLLLQRAPHGGGVLSSPA